jgi:predicted membrane channel-forming protein YqfA (hemolysin III family)
MAYTIHTPFSVGYHAFGTINEDEYVKWRKYDTYGIFLRNIIITFTLSFFTYNNFKYVLLNTSLTIIVVYYGLLKFKESEDKHEKLDKIEQGKLVGLTVFCYLIPVFYKIFYMKIKNKYSKIYRYLFYGTIASIVLVSLYCFRIPEKYFEPGTFNKLGTSHNIMHLGVITSSLCEILYIYYSAKEGNFIKSFR